MRNAQSGGFVKTLLLIVVTVIVLSYFGINLREVLDSELFKNNFLAIWEFLTGIWTEHIVPLFLNFFSR